MKDWLKACVARNLLLSCFGIGTLLLAGCMAGGSDPHPPIGDLRTILGAENAHFSAKGAYGDFESLATDDPYLLAAKWNGVRRGYRITLAVGTDGKSFKAVAVPDKPDDKHNRRFCADESGVIRYTTDGTEPNKDSTPLGE
jgi:hypothetical protein